jgi:DNA-binding beta-propeller fold protein YncE
MCRPGHYAGWLAGLGLALFCACGGAAGGASVNFDPAQTTPTRLVSADGAITVLIPTDVLTGAVKLTLTNRSGGDVSVPGPEGRTLVMAMELTGTSLPTPPSGAGTGTGTSPPTAAALSGTVDVTFSLPFTLRSDLGMPVYAFNTASARYEAAGVSGAIVVEGAATRSNQLKFSISAFGRYAVYSLKPEELPPPTPGGLELLAASTQVRRLGWDAVSDPLVAGYNLYRADEGTESFSKVNSTAPLTLLAYSDELSSPGGYRYRVTSVNTAGVESDPSAVVESPAVDFDVAFTFGAGTLSTPLVLALDASRDRLVIADTGLEQLEVYNLSGVHQSTLEQYPGGTAMDPRGLAYNADGSKLYVTDGTRAQCRILDPDWKAVGAFGSLGKDPGEFETPGAVLAAGDKVLVADVSASTIQAFTPLGVYLKTIATQGSTGGLFDSPAALLLGDAGRLFASDANNNRVQAFKGEDLTFDSVIDYTPEDGGPFLAPDGLAQDFRGRLYVSDTGNHRVVVLDDTGKFLFHFGADGALRVEFSPASGPRGLALDRNTGYLYVCDPGNHRIAVFKT